MSLTLVLCTQKADFPLRLLQSPIFYPNSHPSGRSSSLRITASGRNAVKGSRDLRWSLQDMTALVTGGTRGIGRAIVEELAGLGATVHTCARNEAELSKCLMGWKENEESFLVSGSVCDVSSRVEREKLMSTVSSVFSGKLNILVNNVGTNIRKPMVDFTSEELSTLFRTNFESGFHLSQLAYPLLKASGAGSIVFTSSVSGFVSLQSMTVQGATKGAINQLTRNLACEWAKDNIRCNAVAPWYIKTSMVEQVLSDEEYLKKVYDRTPLGRLGEGSEAQGTCQHQRGIIPDLSLPHKYVVLLCNDILPLFIHILSSMTNLFYLIWLHIELYMIIVA